MMRVNPPGVSGDERRKRASVRYYGHAPDLTHIVTVFTFFLKWFVGFEFRRSRVALIFFLVVVTGRESCR